METLSGTDVYTNEKWSDPFEENGTLTIIGGNTTATDNLVENEMSVQIYPNPTSEQFTISFELKGCKIEVLSIAGQCYEVIHPLEDTHNVTVAYLPSGLYLLRILNQNNQLLEVQKLIKE